MKLAMETLQELLAYHYARREWLYHFLTKIPSDEFVRGLGVGWGSIRSTLVHCLDAEEFWIQHRLQKRPQPDYDFADYPDVGAVRTLAAQVQERTRTYLSSLQEEDLGRIYSVTDSNGIRLEFTTSKVFLHVITHDTHHRGQVVALARQLGYAPPELDLL